MRIDLHTHSTVSDGTLSPTGVIEAAVAARLDVVALTDHDTLHGWPEAAQAAGRLMVEFVPGVEISCRWYGVQPAISLHLLAYYVDPTDAALVAELARVRQAREQRAERMVELMRADGLDVTWAEVLGYAAGGTVGRPHLAQALIRRGLVATVGEAFAPDMLGQRWRVPKEDTDVFTALDLVRGAGGVAVFAHPRATKRGRVVPDSLIEELAERGLFGVEADHEDHSPQERAEVRALADRLGLVCTGSSDFHGTNKPTPIGANLTDPAVFAAIKDAARAHRGIRGVSSACSPVDPAACRGRVHRWIRWRVVGVFTGERGKRDLTHPDGTIGGCPRPSRSRWGSSPSRCACSSVRRASWAPSRTVPAGTGTATWTVPRPPRVRRGPTTPSARASTRRCGPGSTCPPPGGARRPCRRC